MFKLRPYSGLLIAALLSALIGGLLSAYFLSEDAYNEGSHRGMLALVSTAIVVIALIICAFSKYQFSHLHHHRPGYKRG